MRRFILWPRVQQSHPTPTLYHPILMSQSIIAILNIRFIWEPYLLPKWPKMAQSLCHKLKSRFDVLSHTQEEPFSLLVILIGDTKNELHQRCDAIVEQCTLHGIGRIEDEMRTLHAIDDLYESNSDE